MATKNEAEIILRRRHELAVALLRSDAAIRGDSWAEFGATVAAIARDIDRELTRHAVADAVEAEAGKPSGAFDASQKHPPEYTGKVHKL